MRVRLRAVPRPKTKGPLIPVRLSAAAHEIAERRAQAKGKSVREYVTSGLERWLLDTERREVVRQIEVRPRFKP